MIRNERGDKIFGDRRPLIVAGENHDLLDKLKRDRAIHPVQLIGEARRYPRSIADDLERLYDVGLVAKVRSSGVRIAYGDLPLDSFFMTRFGEHVHGIVHSLDQAWPSAKR